MLVFSLGCSTQSHEFPYSSLWDVTPILLDTNCHSKKMLQSHQFSKKVGELGVVVLEASICFGNLIMVEMPGRSRGQGRREELGPSSLLQGFCFNGLTPPLF